MVEVARITLMTQDDRIESLENICKGKDANALKTEIMGVVLSTQAENKFELAKELGEVLNKNKHNLNKAWIPWGSAMRVHSMDNDLYLTSLDCFGNMHYLKIALKGQFESRCKIKEFYIGSSNSSIVRYSDIDEFLAALRAEIIKRSDKGDSSFEITIED